MDGWREGWREGGREGGRKGEREEGREGGERERGIGREGYILPHKGAQLLVPLGLFVRTKHKI